MNQPPHHVEMSGSARPATGGCRPKMRADDGAAALPRKVGGVARGRVSPYEGSMPRIAVGYVRVSTVRQALDGDSLPAQRAKLEAWALAHDAQLMAVHADEGVSGAAIANRPGVLAAVDDACHRRCPLVVASLSRLVRSVADAISIGERLERAGADLVSLSEQIDTSSASGRLVFRLLALLGQFERELIAERTAGVLSHLREQGRRIGAVPYGHSLSADGLHLVPDPAEQAVVAAICGWRGEGLTLRAIARRLEEEGVTNKAGSPRWRPGTVAAILRRSAAAEFVVAQPA